MSSHHATADVWVSNLDSEDEAETIRELIEAALANYQATVTVTATAYDKS